MQCRKFIQQSSLTAFGMGVFGSLLSNNKKVNQKIKQVTQSIIVIFFLTFITISWKNSSTDKQTISTNSEQKKISVLLDAFNIAAAKADFNTYFNFYTENAIFIGTDATERWDKKAFMAYAKPHFDKGKAWNFTSIERHIYFDKTGKIAWFDELLNTQMKICRGSGVLVKQGDIWKVQQYVLSASIPNDIMNAVVKMKAPIEDSLIKIYFKK